VLQEAFTCLRYHTDYLSILTMESIPEFELLKAEDLIQKHHTLFVKLYCQGVDKKKTFISIFTNILLQTFVIL
jgi:hypothetical protein